MRRLLCFLLLFSLGSQITFAASSKAQAGNSKDINVNQPVIWASPERLVRDLRSTDGDIRRKALDLVGVPSSYSSAKFVEVQLRIGEMGRRHTDVAIVSLDLDLTNWYAAVAINVGSNWRRIGTFECWCKYESDDLLSQFVRLDSAQGDENELVVHSSGGGTGLYERTEDRFRLRGKMLRKVMSFEDLRQECLVPSKDVRCNIERRIFSSAAEEGLSVLIETKKTIDPAVVPDVIFREPELQIQYTAPISCKGFRWSEKEVRYVPAPLPKDNSCSQNRKEE